MAFDDATRGRLQKFVGDARTLLMIEFTNQFQQDYGLDPESGGVASLNALKLDDRRLETARILRQIFDHYLASAIGQSQEVRKAVLGRMVREQAFTTLNRLAALRMMEARGLVMECVAKGYQSKAFQLYQRVAGSALGETGDTYRVFLLSLCDIFSADLPTLFDRHYPNGRLSPREPALLPLLDLVNATDIAPLWGEDETIGWIYQYFNDADERKRMRDPKQGGSQAPRNSRELAVRNQFFTPRYVVEFLVDNTLGRLWFDWTGGRTGLRDRCRYLLVTPDERPEAARRLRDPRTIKLLDPACGSMHFGLYAFDLFLEIYREAWAWEQTYGPGCLDIETGGSPGLKPLCMTYANEAEFLRDVPRLVIERNICGIDIDPRAAQIASLALWLRGQRAWHEAGVKAQDRPHIGLGNVVPAMPPPAEVQLRACFMEDLDPLDAQMFDQFLDLLKGLPDLGVLLQIEQELPRLFRKIYGEHGQLFSALDLGQWQQAEIRLREALVGYAQAARVNYQGRLFVDDSLELLRFIDMLNFSFDVVVMNPPFGEPVASQKSTLAENYPDTASEIYAIFINRSLQLLSKSGLVGVISSRSGLFLPRLAAWRLSLLNSAQLECLVDLGNGVLDSALVETSAYVIGASKDATHRRCKFLNLLGAQNREAACADLVHNIRLGKNDARLSDIDPATFKRIPTNPFAYWVDPTLLSLYASNGKVGEHSDGIRIGLMTADDFRFLRLAWEVGDQRSGWMPFSKGGEYSPYLDDIHLLVRWDGGDIYWSVPGKDHPPSNVWMLGMTIANHFGRPGVSYTRRSTSGFNPKILQAGTLFSDMGPTANSTEDNSEELYCLLAVLFSRPSRYLLELFSGSADEATSGSAARRYSATIVNSIPFPELGDNVRRTLSSSVRLAILNRMTELGLDETSPYYTPPRLFLSPDIEEYCRHQQTAKYQRTHEILEAYAECEKYIADSYGLDTKAISLLDDEVTPLFGDKARSSSDPDLLQKYVGLTQGELISHAQTLGIEGRFVTKKEFVADRKIELALLLANARSCDLLELKPSGSDQDKQALEWDILSFSVGVAFGRFDLRLATGERELPPKPEPFDPLPELQPAMLPKGCKPFHEFPGILVDDPDHKHDLAHLLELILVELGCGISYDLRLWLQKEFFPFHLRRYSKSRRKAPIYWPISTASGGYTLWIYYPQLSKQTLYTAVNDFIEPRLSHISSEVGTLRGKGASRTSEDEKMLQTKQAFEVELREFRQLILEIAEGYNPDLNDGVQISAAPLAPLFRFKPWQSLLRETWTELKRGDHDWSHLALAYWPDRVRQKCKTNKSLAIAHNSEELYEPPSKNSMEQGSGGRKRRRVAP